MKFSISEKFDKETGRYRLRTSNSEWPYVTERYALGVAKVLVEGDEGSCPKERWCDIEINGDGTIHWCEEELSASVVMGLLAHSKSMEVGDSDYFPAIEGSSWVIEIFRVQDKEHGLELKPFYRIRGMWGSKSPRWQCVYCPFSVSAIDKHLGSHLDSGRKAALRYLEVAGFTIIMIDTDVFSKLEVVLIKNFGDLATQTAFMKELYSETEYARIRALLDSLASPGNRPIDKVWNDIKQPGVAYSNVEGTEK